MESDNPAGNQSSVDLDEIIRELDVGPGILPERGIRAAQTYSDQIIPLLIDSIRDGKARVQSGDITDTHLPFFSLMLLTEFGAREALPTIVESLLLPNVGVQDLYGEALFEWLPGILADFYADDQSVIDEFIANRAACMLVRGGALHAYLYLVHDNKITCDEVIERLRRHLRVAIDQRDELVTSLVSALAQFSPDEMYDEIDEAFRLNLVDEVIIYREEFEEIISGGDAHFQEQLQYCGASGVSDTLEDLRGFYPFVADPKDDEFEPMYESVWDQSQFPDEPVDDLLAPSHHESTIVNLTPKVGRNEPCPCGSGKKHKKCCGRN